MPTSNLLNVPKNEQDWSIWSFSNRDSNARIRQAIRDQSGGIAAIGTTSNGSGYTSAPTVTITDARGSGSGATAFATYTVSGGFYSITLTLLTAGTLYIEPVVTLSGGGGTGATGEAIAYDIIDLIEYQLDPIAFNAFQDFLERNSQAHDDFNGALGLQSSDLEELDINDPNQLQSWIYLNWQEIRNAEQALGI